LASEAIYAATELPDGSARSAGARSAIAALLGMLAATRAIAAGSRADPGTDARARAAFLEERTSDLHAQEALAAAGLDDLLEGVKPCRTVRLRVHYDVFGAALTAMRTVAAVALSAVFCVYAGWPGVTLLLVQVAAFTALLGIQPNPSAAGLYMAWALPLPAVMAGVVGFGILPLVSGYVPFALSVGLAAFLAGLLARYSRTAQLGPGLLLYFTLLLSPSNTESFDLSAFLNNVLVQVVALVFMVVAFQLVLPVSRRRRLFRVVHAVQRDLRRTLRHGAKLDQPAVQSLLYDRLTQATTWLGRPTRARLAVLHRLYAFAELDIALRRAYSGLDEAAAVPGLAEPVALARACLLQPRPAALAAAAGLLARHPAAVEAGNAVKHAASGLYGAHLLLEAQWTALQRYGVIGA